MLPDAAVVEVGMDQGVDGNVPDQAMPQGCASGILAKPLGTNAVGCPGVFSAGQARSRCATGYVPCSSATSVDTTKCNQEPGFFMADQAAYWAGSMSFETCASALTNQLIYGCGSGGRAGAQMCGGFPKVIDLGSGVTSANGTLDQAANTNPSYGVLCCKL